MEFLRARRAQNLSWMRLAEQSFSSMAQLQKTTGGTGDALARLWTAQAAFIRDTASVYRPGTTHLAPQPRIVGPAGRGVGETCPGTCPQVGKYAPAERDRTPPNFPLASQKDLQIAIF